MTGSKLLVAFYQCVKSSHSASPFPLHFRNGEYLARSLRQTSRAMFNGGSAYPNLKTVGFGLGALLSSSIQARDPYSYARDWPPVFPTYRAHFPRSTGSLRNSRWRTISTRSLPPVWYHCRRKTQGRDFLTTE